VVFWQSILGDYSTVLVLAIGVAVFVYSNTANKRLKEDIWRAEKVCPRSCCVFVKVVLASA
jgi:hypothetical protein